MSAMDYQVTSTPRLVVLVSGRGTNLQAIIEAIARKELHASIAAVISDRADAPALERAAASGIETVVLDYKTFPGTEAYHATLLAQLDKLAPDLIILSGYMRILEPTVVRKYRWRILNIHPSLLPAFPGLHPHRQAIEYGVKVSGCTVHFVDEGVDTGPIIMQQAVPVEDGDDPDTLAARVLAAEHKLYPEAIRRVLSGSLSITGRRVVQTDDGSMHNEAT